MRASSTATEPQEVRVGALIRDVVIVWVLTSIGGFVAGIATGGPSRSPDRFLIASAVSNVLLGTLAFTISGSLTPHRRWVHLSFVAFGAWLTSVVNVIFFGVSLGNWLIGAFVIAIIMGLGGAISYAFSSGSKQSATATNAALQTSSHATAAHPQEPVYRSAKALLDLRLAGGEITMSEYHDIHNTITNAKNCTVKTDRINLRSSSGPTIPNKKRHLYYIECPICKSTLTATDDDRGMEQSCPTCLGIFQVPYLLRRS